MAGNCQKAIPINFFKSQKIKLQQICREMMQKKLK